ncbi:thiamine-binding protein [uncultured Eudoraea sp.]|uniref:thiamine-binding protein n=1 Tax=uncultured Eudoraea sp. TaxID=1035614 RepID=UPI00261125A7|nr:thiamine-binding protein [uncultured Eudoraea sp.]
MDISVELTLTPLQDNYEELIKKFIKKIRDSGFTISENPLSTQIYGDYDDIMEWLNTEIKLALELVENGLMYIKIVKSDRSNYEPNF